MDLKPIETKVDIAQLEKDFPVPVKGPKKLDIGAGQNVTPGFIGIDIMPGSDIVQDLFQFPWRDVEDESVVEIISNHFFEHVPGPLRGKFMDELYRIMMWGAKATITTPYYSSMRAVQDYTHAFPPICEASYLYFNKEWRVQNKLDHYDVACDFDFSYSYVYMDPRWINSAQDARDFANKQYLNVIADISVILTKTKREIKPTN
jgi:hypothetical protein